LLLLARILVCPSVVVWKVLTTVVVHPLVEMVGDIKGPIVVSSKLVIYEDNRIPARRVFPHENVPCVDVVVRENHR